MQRVSSLKKPDVTEAKLLKPISINEIPVKVDLKDLHENSKLIDEDTIATILKNKNKLAQGRNKKKNLLNLIDELDDLEYDIASVNKCYFAIYKGKSSNKHLGAGGYGVVKLAQNIENGEWVALKITAVNTRSNENKILKKTNTAIGHYTRVKENTLKQQEIFMKLATGRPLSSYRHLKKNLAPIEYIDILISLATEIHTLHKKGILHRDIKPGNTFYDRRTSSATLVDFGLSVFTDKHGGYIGHKGSGTETYLAPEATPDDDDDMAIYDEKTEVYAFAITAARLLELSLRENNMFKSIDHNDIVETEFEDKLPHGKTQHDILNLLNASVNNKPDERPSFTSIKKSLKKIRDNLSDLSKLITVVYFDIGKYIESNKKQKSKILKNLMYANKVFLIDCQSKNLLHYQRINRELIQSNIYPHQHVLQYCDRYTDLPKLISKHISSLPNKHHRIHTATLYINKHDMDDARLFDTMSKSGISLTAQNAKPSYGEAFSTSLYLTAIEDEVSTVITLLTNEQLRLSDKKPSRSKFNRISLFSNAENTIINANQSGSIQYKTIITCLKKLRTHLKEQKNSAFKDKSYDHSSLILKTTKNFVWSRVREQIRPDYSIEDKSSTNNNTQPGI